MITKYKIEGNPISVYLKKHYCAKCGNRLRIQYTARIVNYHSTERKDYDFSVGDGIYKDDITFKAGEFYCSRCDLVIPIREMVKRKTKKRQ